MLEWMALNKGGGGGELFKEGFRKLLSKEWNYLKKQLIRNPVCQNNKQKQQYQKNNQLFRKNNRLFIPANKIKTEFKEIKDREIAHKSLYWFTLNPELHPVFSETTKEIHEATTPWSLTPQPRKWPWSPQDTHFSWPTHQH